jgi:metal-responsive CopG/Arc/MetJ family transcriptional regulator
MKTIAVSIDEDLLAAIDRVARRRRPSRRGQPAARRPNRSEVIREAVREFLGHRERREQESRDRQVLAAHRTRLARQLEALVGEQAEP